MTAANVMPQTSRERPLVVVVSSVPVLGEAVAAALEFANVRVFSTEAGDVGGLFRSLRPDAAVVDSERGADEAAAYSQITGMPVVQIAVRERVLRVHDGAWRNVTGEGPTPEGIRNVVAGALFSERQAP